MSERFAGAVIVAAGRGERFGDRGKVLSVAAGRPLLAWSLDAMLGATTIGEILVVCGEHTRHDISELLDGLSTDIPIRSCVGGEQRQDSVRAGLACLSGSVEVAVIHDAARPLATSEMTDDVANAARTHGAAITAVPVTDTIKEVEGDRIVRTVPRDVLQAAQTPQAFRLEPLLHAMSGTEVALTDEAGVFEQAGIPVLVRPGSHANIKVTMPEDLLLVDALLRARIAKGDQHVSS
jgi:2-C-methyl-D-erythritol 4-phosphate cytidylyltransferase